MFKNVKWIFIKTTEEDGQKLSDFSVVIRARNEERWIGYAIQSALDHLVKPEIIIVDNNSTDKTVEIVKFFAENPNLNSETKTIVE